MVSSAVGNSNGVMARSSRVQEMEAREHMQIGGPAEGRVPHTADAPCGSWAVALSSGRAMLSVVIPLYNEEESLELLYTRLKASLNTYAPNHEIYFMDDGSRDGSPAKLRELWERDEHVSVLRFRRNFGKAAALSAAFQQVKGDLVLMMDADLQDQPEELPRLIAKMDGGGGYDLVTGWKRKRHDPLNKTLPSKLFNGTVSGYYNLDIHDLNCGFKLMRVEVAKEIRLYGEFHRFIPVLAATKGFRVTECEVEHAPRVHGVSKYGAKRLITGAFDFSTSVLLTRFAGKPLHLFGFAAVGCVAAAGLIGTLALGLSLFGGPAGLTWASWACAALMGVMATQLFAFGLVSEVVVNGAYSDSHHYATCETLEKRAATKTETAMPIDTRTQDLETLIAATLGKDYMESLRAAQIAREATSASTKKAA